MKRINIQFIVLLFVSSFAYGQAGYLDKTFGDGGIAIIKSSNKQFYPFDIKILPDGKMLECGLMSDTNVVYLYVVKRNDDGAIDSTFGNSGFCYYRNDFGFYKSYIYVYPDNKFLVYGHFSKENVAVYAPSIIRFHASGTVDSSFGDSGLYLDTNSENSGYFCRLKVDADGSIIALGATRVNDDFHETHRPTITRISSIGQNDTSFGDMGTKIVGTEGDTGYVYDAIFYKDSQCVFSCTVRWFSGAGLYMLCTDMNGVVDSSFGSDGVVSEQLSDVEDYVNAIVENSDEHLLCLAEIVEGNKYQSALTSFVSTGSMDYSFGNFGIAQKPDDGYKHYFKLCTIDSNQNILAVGYLLDSINTHKWATIRYHKNGLIDSSYGINSVSQDFTTNMYVRSVAIQGDGKYLVLGQGFEYDRSILCRINNEGTSTVSHVTATSSTISLHPTPSTDNCTITYTLPTSSDCSLTLRDESGREVRTFMSSEFRAAGKHEDELDLRGLAAGVYFLSLEHDGKTETAKLIKQ